MAESKITFLSGLDTIGSNIISIENDGYRVLMDFGALRGVSMEEMLDTNRTEILYNEKKLPQIKEFYWASLDGKDPFQTIICLSHLHIDHIGSLKHILPNIPIYALDRTAPFLEKLVKHHLLPDYHFQVIPISKGQSIQHGPFTIRFFESDHDTLGIASIFVELPDLKLIHSGDVRLTGYHPEKVLTWASYARQWEPDILLLEGTTFSHLGLEPDPLEIKIAAYTQDISALTELALLSNIKALLAEHPQSLVAFNGYPQNVERLYHFMHLVNGLDRTLVVLPGYYALIESYLSEKDAIELYSESMAEKMCLNPQAYALVLDEDAINLLNTLPGGIYLHSNATPLGPYMDNYESFILQVVSYGWAFYHANVSGHALPEDLLMLAYTIQAKVTVPWHTFQRGRFSEGLMERGLDVWCPEQGKTYSLDEININK